MSQKEMIEQFTNQEENKVIISKKFEDYFKKVEDSLQRKSIQTVIDDIDEYPNILANTEGVESIDKLNAKHKENFTLASEKYIEEYEEIYGKMREDEKWIFMASTYFARGEGHITCLLMTQALPCDDDYDSSLQDVEGTKLLTTQAYRAVKEFHKEFGASSLYNLGFHTREAFFEKYSIMIPYSLIKLKDKPCMLTFKTKLQYSFP
jgi:hypothetical protein